MDILASDVVATLSEAPDSEADVEDPELDTEELGVEATPGTADNPGPWALVITTHGFGKRVPVSQFRLQNRAGKGLTATKFKSRKQPDQMTSLRIVNANDELMIVTSRGIVIRQSVKDISSQSRAATGVRVQRLDEDDFIAAVTLVPPEEMEPSDCGEAEVACSVEDS